MDNPAFGYCVYKYNNGKYEPYYHFEPNVDLFGAYTVATFALDWAIKQGYEKAVLFGILDGDYQVAEFKTDANYELYYKHFYDDVLHVKHYQVLEAHKKEIYSYSSKINIEIPYLNI
jgi:hypothetical protein